MYIKLKTIYLFVCLPVPFHYYSGMSMYMIMLV